MMTPELSRAAAQIADSPYWGGAAGFDRWQAFVAALERYGDYARLPAAVKKAWRTAERWQRDNHAPDSWLPAAAARGKE